MAVNMLPNSWITGYTGNGTTISIPYSSLPEITAATEANTAIGETPATGSIANVLHAILDAVVAKYDLLTTKPVNMGVFKSVTFNQTTGKYAVSYTVNFTATPAVGALNPDAET